MTRYVCPGAASLSEFVGLPTHEYGDCGPDATLMALHAVWPAKYALTPYGLGAIDATEQAHGYAASNGAQNIPQMDAYLTAIGIPHKTIGYSAFNANALHSDLQASFGPGGCMPVIVETSTAGAGLPQDEPAVQYHYFTVVGTDTTARTPDGYTGAYLRVDGDSNTDDPNGGTTPPIATSWAEIAASKPVAYIILQATGGGTVNIPTGWTDDGTTLHAPNGVTVVQGFRDYILANGWPSGNWPLVESYGSASIEPGNPSIGAGTRQDFRLGSLGWTQSTGVYVIWIGQDFRALLAHLQSLTAQLGDLQAADAKEEASETSTPAPAPDPQTAADAALGAALRALLKQAA